MHRAILVSLVAAMALSAAVIAITPPASAQQTETHELLGAAEFGLGLQASGSACCISMRQWTDAGRGLELTFMADRVLMLGLRGMSQFADTEALDPYAGAGINLIFGPRVSPGIPLTSLQFLLGLDVGLPFLPPQLAINFEAALEFELDREFYSYIGGGVHFYF